MTCCRLELRKLIALGLGREAPDTSHLIDVESQVKGVPHLTLWQ